MKIISKNCSKIQGEERRKKNMATIGVGAYLLTDPKLFLDAIPARKIKELEQTEEEKDMNIIIQCKTGKKRQGNLHPAFEKRIMHVVMSFITDILQQISKL